MESRPQVHILPKQCHFNRIQNQGQNLEDCKSIYRLFEIKDCWTFYSFCF